MNTSKHNINTGKLLNDFIIKNRITKAHLGRDINRDGVSINHYIANTSIQTGILMDISYALKHNFFHDIANYLPEEFTKTELIDHVKATAEKDKLNLIENLQEEIKVLRIQNELLLKVHRI